MKFGSSLGILWDHVMPYKGIKCDIVWCVYVIWNGGIYMRLWIVKLGFGGIRVFMPWSAIDVLMWYNDQLMCILMRIDVDWWKE